MIKSKKTLSSQMMGSNNLQDLHSSILDKIMQFDKLNQQYKNKQQQHFIKMFMNVLQKMGNDLILAQQAYRNIDIEVKRDKYIVQLAAQLSFFKEECFTLKKQIRKMKSEVESVKLDNETIQNQIKSIRVAYERKTKECDYMKEINAHLKNQIKTFKNQESGRIFKFTTTHKESHIQNLASEREKPNNTSDNKEEVKVRFSRTQQTSRRVQIGKQADLANFPKQQNCFILSPKRPNTNQIKFRTTNHSSHRRSSQQRSRLQQVDFAIADERIN